MAYATRRDTTAQDLRSSTATESQRCNQNTRPTVNSNTVGCGQKNLEDSISAIGHNPNAADDQPHSTKTAYQDRLSHAGNNNMFVPNEMNLSVGDPTDAKSTQQHVKPSPRLIIADGTTSTSNTHRRDNRYGENRTAMDITTDLATNS